MERFVLARITRKRRNTRKEYFGDETNESHPVLSNASPPGWTP